MPYASAMACRRSGATPRATPARRPEGSCAVHARGDRADQHTNEYLYLYRKADDDMTTKRYVWLTTSNSGGIQYKQGFDTLWEAITTMYDLG